MPDPLFPMESTYLNGRVGMFSDYRRPPEAAEYEAALRNDPESYPAQLMGMMNSLNEMKTAAAASDMDGAKAHYDHMRAFFATHQDETSRAASINPRNDPFLASIRAGAVVGQTRQYDKVELETPYGTMSAGALFGPDGKYESLRTESILSARFDKPVADLVTGAADDPTGGQLKSIIGDLIVNPVVRQISAVRRGVDVPEDLSQHAALASRVYETGADDVGMVGADAVRATVNHILSRHMEDSTARTMYDWAMKTLGDMKTSFEATHPDRQFDGAQATHRMFGAYESLIKQALPPGAKHVPDSLSRWMAMSVTSLSAPGSAMDLDDFNVRRGLLEVTDLLARGQRAGIPIVPLAQSGGAQFKDAVAGYVQARKQGFDPPPDNFLTRLTQLWGAATRLSTAGWAPTPDSTRADPTAEVGTAPGVFRATSGSPDVDNATLAVFKSLFSESVQGITDGKAPLDAMLDALNDPAAEDRAVADLADAMVVPEPVARGVLGQVKRQLQAAGPGSLAPFSLERAVADFAFQDEGIVEDQSLLPVKDAAANWYTAHVGASGKYFDALVADSGWDMVLDDPVVGFGDQPQNVRVAQKNALKQLAKRDMLDAAKKGLPVERMMRHRARQGVYYYVSGYVDRNGVTHQGLPVGKDGRLLDKQAVPLVDMSFGDLDMVQQPLAGWTVGGQLLPVVNPSSFSANPGAFGRAMAFYKALYKKEREAAAQAAAQAAQAAGQPGGW